MKYYGKGISMGPKNIFVDLKDELKVYCDGDLKKDIYLSEYSFGDYQICVCSDKNKFADSIDMFCEVHNIQKNVFFQHTTVSSGSLSQWRTGLHNPSSRIVRGIEDYVGMPIEKFLAVYKKGPPPKDGGHTYAEFMDLFGRASPEIREAVLTLLRSATPPHATQDADVKD